MKIKSPLKPQAGASFVEATIVLGVLITIFLVIFDLYFMHATYVNLSQFAREGVLSGNGMSYFRANDPTGAGACNGVIQGDLQKAELHYMDCQGNALGPTCGHYLIQWRLELLMKSLNLNFVDEAARTVTTRCVISTIGSSSVSTLYVNLSVPFQGFTPFFRNTVLKVNQIGIAR